MKHSPAHIIEMAWSFATEWIKAVHMFKYRLLHELPEDKIFEHKIFRDNVDFHCFLISCRRLERAVLMAHNSWNNTQEKKLKETLTTFKRKTPYLGVLRNVGEHFDDYLFQRGNDKSVDSRGLRVYSVAFEKEKTYKVKWLDYEIDIGQTAKIADELYKNFVVFYKHFKDNEKLAPLVQEII